MAPAGRSGFSASQRLQTAGTPRDEPPVGFGDDRVMVEDFGSPARAFSVLACGQSSDSGAPHSSDQIRLFAGHRLRPGWFGDSDIKAQPEREHHT
jgi:hypothetical protein